MAQTEADVSSNLTVVADAGPLLHLDELEALDVLRDFREVLVVPAVRDEVLKHRADALTRCPNPVIVASIPESAVVNAVMPLFTLDGGERDALACCVQRQAALFLTDDTAARLAAQALNIRAHGTIGLLIRAVRRNQRTSEDVVALLNALPTRSSLHVRREFLQDIIRGVCEEWHLPVPSTSR